MSETLLSVKNLSYSTPDGKMLSQDVNFTVHAGDILIIRGPNGVGKTTLLNVLLGRHKHFQGEINFNTTKREIAYLPQLQNVVFHFPITMREILQISKREKIKEADLYKLDTLGSLDLDLAWNTASGGERKRTLITRTLMKDSELYLFDEPLNHLDLISKEKISAALASFVQQSKSKKALIMVSHESAHESFFKYEGLNLKYLNLGVQ